MEAVRTSYAESAVSIRSFFLLCSLWIDREKDPWIWPLTPFLLFYYREYSSIDGLDVDLHINTTFLDVSKIHNALSSSMFDVFGALVCVIWFFWSPQTELAKAWRINPSEPIVIRLHFSPSQYLDGPGGYQHGCCELDSLSFTVNQCDNWVGDVSHHRTVSWDLSTVQRGQVHLRETATKVSVYILFMRHFQTY